MRDRYFCTLNRSIIYTVYGIPNCDTVKKTLGWLNSHKIPYKFHDYKKEGITAAKLKTWSGQVGWENFFNKKSTSWRGLDAKTQASVTNEKVACKLMVENTSIIKRPVIEKGDTVVTVGFNEAVYEKLFKK